MEPTLWEDIVLPWPWFGCEDAVEIGLNRIKLNRVEIYRYDSWCLNTINLITYYHNQSESNGYSDRGRQGI